MLPIAPCILCTASERARARGSVRWGYERSTRKVEKNVIEGRGMRKVEILFATVTGIPFLPCIPLRTSASPRASPALSFRGRSTPGQPDAPLTAAPFSPVPTEPSKPFFLLTRTQLRFTKTLRNC